MKAPLSWLREFVPQAPVAEDIAKILLQRGLEVEAIERPRGFGPEVVLGKILSIEKHPSADRLQVAKVDAGPPAPLSIVCGAANIQVGQTVPTAKVGAVLPGDFKIKKSKIRGVESEGMLCSAKELQLESASEGILILHEGQDGPKTGTTFDEFRGTSDPVLDVNVTPNRPDCLSLLGLSREIASALGVPMVWRPATFPRWGGSGPLSVEIQDRRACPAYSGIAMNGAVNRPSPPLAVKRLESCGLRSLGSLVDATNYLLLELGHPVHVFDRRKIAGTRLSVRAAKPGESLEALDGLSYALSGEDLVIADAKGPVALAGIIGGRPTAAGSDSSQIFLECAVFDPVQIRNSSRRLKITTDSSARFERKVPAPGLPLALARLAHLMTAWSGAAAEGDPVSEGDIKDHRVMIPFDPEKAAAWLGYPEPAEAGKKIKPLFHSIGLECVPDPSGLQVAVPYYRPDLRLPEDLYEEVARTLGVDPIPETWPGGTLPQPRKDPLSDLASTVRATLGGFGFQEVLTLPFLEDKTSGPEGLGPPVALLNPLLKDEGYLRNSLAPGLVQAAARNLTRGQRDLRLFEVGRVFSAGPDGNTAGEETWAGGLMSGEAQPQSWGENRSLDAFDIRGVVEALGRRAHLKLSFQPADVAGGIPGSCWVLNSGDKTLGWAGLASPKAGLLPRNAPPIYVFELSLTQSLGRRTGGGGSETPSKFPSMGRDINFLIPLSLPAEKLEGLIRRTAGKDLESVRLRDVYTGTQVPQGYRSLTYALVFRASDKTLVEADVDGKMSGILGSCEKELGVKIRS